jgi:hypothetical protein
MVGLCSEARAQGGLSKEELAAQGIMVVEPEEAGRRHMLEGWVLGLRAGAAIPTEKVLKNVGNGTSVGPAINAEALYAIREWVRAGLMLEWHQHSIDFWGPKFGTLSTVSLLPTVQFRPTAEMMQEYGVTWAVPYASLGTGINFHSFSKDAQTGSASVSFDNTFALRLATGLDFPITSRLAFNTEVAWNRDSGSYTVNGVKADFNASTLNLLVGLRMQF